MIEPEVEKPVESETKEVDDREVEIGPEKGENDEMEEDSIITKRSVENNNDNVEPPSKRAKQEEMQIINENEDDSDDAPEEVTYGLNHALIRHLI